MSCGYERTNGNIPINLHHNISHSYVESTNEEKKIMSEIKEISDRIAGRKSRRIGDLSAYTELIEKLESEKSRALNLDLSPLENFADSAEKLASILDDITLRFKTIVRVDANKTLYKIQHNLHKIENLYKSIDSFRDQVEHSDTIRCYSDHTRQMESLREAIAYTNSSIHNIVSS